VPFAAGAAVDVLARLLAGKLSDPGRPAGSIVREPPGPPVGTLAADQVAKSPPDGYTILKNTMAPPSRPRSTTACRFDAVHDSRR